VILAVHEWGEQGAARAVFLHGITSHGRHGARLAERLPGRFHVQAPDLLGHGDSPYTPPWSLAAHVDALLETLGREPATWIGHSFGARVALELAAREPTLARRLVLLDPVIQLPPEIALIAAERARPDRAYASFAEGIDRRYEESGLQHAPRELVEEELSAHLVRSDDGRWRYRYSQAAVVAAYGEMASTPPEFELLRVPTLVVLGKSSYLSQEEPLARYRASLGDVVQVVGVDGGHTLLWDALADTAAAVESFLA
jgi:lipase